MQNSSWRRKSNSSRIEKVFKLTIAIAGALTIQGCQTGQFDPQAFGAALNQAHQMDLQNQQQHNAYIQRANEQNSQRLPSSNRPQKVIIQQQCAWNDYACQAYNNPSYGN